ncbi:flavocytochrome c [Shewanella zhangzhouensis]|uniref:flavocytochrome c n=1 Tax=Shewanella zhangzhouensis TaxID=2864213 RepID=UPI001C65F6F4|nr:flavocytochrome c [Shewanella zhangzhouensis]QYK07010.1 flavocytochrome c [Shewanella zhangzhouensis]
MKKSDNLSLGRRQFLTGLGATGVVLATPGISVACESNKVNWDKEAEVVVVGTGFAGLAAATEATNNGAKSVIMIEKMGELGGNSAINGGLFSVPGSPLQKKSNVSDSPELMVEDQKKSGRGIANPEILLHIATHAIDAYDMCIKAGVQFNEQLVHMGGHSAPRSHSTANRTGSGITLPLTEQLLKRGVTIQNRTKFLDFVTSEDGSVQGIKVREGYYFGDENSGDIKYIRATRGVIMASGGFSQNIRLRMSQDPTLTEELRSTNAPGQTGEGLLAMLKLGATPVHMSHIQIGPWASPDEKGMGYMPLYAVFNFPHSILVDRRTGKRFVNELADRKIRADAELSCRDDKGNPYPPILITSKKSAEGSHHTLDNVLRHNVGWELENLDAIAKRFDVPLEALQQQVEDWNAYVDKGNDEQFGKPMNMVKGQKLEAPFIVVRLWPKVHYCQGGAQVNKYGEVLSADTGMPISGLYAAGEVTGGIHGVSRLGSTSITETLVMGMTAGRTVMKNTA